MNECEVKLTFFAVLAIVQMMAWMGYGFYRAFRWYHAKWEWPC